MNRRATHFERGDAATLADAQCGLHIAEPFVGRGFMKFVIPGRAVIGGERSAKSTAHDAVMAKLAQAIRQRGFTHGDRAAFAGSDIFHWMETEYRAVTVRARSSRAVIGRGTERMRGVFQHADAARGGDRGEARQVALPASDMHRHHPIERFAARRQYFRRQAQRRWIDIQQHDLGTQQQGL